MKSFDSIRDSSVWKTYEVIWLSIPEWFLKIISHIVSPPKIKVSSPPESWFAEANSSLVLLSMSHTLSTFDLKKQGKAWSFCTALVQALSRPFSLRVASIFFVICPRLLMRIRGNEKWLKNLKNSATFLALVSKTEQSLAKVPIFSILASHFRRFPSLLWQGPDN